MKENKGFTLIELLAVIVILAIIALIATPVIMNIIKSSKESAAVDSAKLIVSQFELAYSQASILCDGEAPALAKIKANFEMDNATFGDSAITDELGNTCAVTTTDNAISVACTNSNYSKVDAATTIDMELGTCAD